MCSFYHELHWLIARRPVRCIAEMLVCLGVRGTLHRLLQSADMGLRSHALYVLRMPRGPLHVSGVPAEGQKGACSGSGLGALSVSAAQVAYVCVAANAWRDEQTRRRFAAAHRQHMAAAAAAAAR